MSTTRAGVDRSPIVVLPPWLRSRLALPCSRSASKRLRNACIIQVLSGLEDPSQARYAGLVASPVGYQSCCPVGAALSGVGERWALLVVRDLLLGPRRYSELLAGLGGIGTDILAARLRTLREHGVV